MPRNGHRWGFAVASRGGEARFFGRVKGLVARSTLVLSRRLGLRARAPTDDRRRVRDREGEWSLMTLERQGWLLLILGVVLGAMIGAWLAR
jgi:hypothetical protein